MLRMKIFQVEAAISSDKIFELEAAISSVPPHAPDVQIRFVKAVYAMSRTVSSCISDDGIERINGVCWPNLASSVPAQSVGSHM